MYQQIIISLLLLFEYAISLDTPVTIESKYEETCLTDKLHGDFSDKYYNKLIKRRKNVRNLLNKNLHRIQDDTLLIKVVFHNVHKIVNGESQHSFCDYQGWGEDYLTENNQTICNDRLHKALEILNEQFAPAQIKFIKHPLYPTMREITDSLYHHITGAKIDFIKEEFNIPNTLNIYLDFCLGNINTENNTCESSIAGFSTYPENINQKELSIAIRHFSFPGMNDNRSSNNVYVLPHEIGHYFSLEHIEGNWFRKNEHPPIEFVNGDDCNYRGDLICDTPGQPGVADEAFYHAKYDNEMICKYHGYGGDYDHGTNLLKIGGYENISLTNASIPWLTDNTWCDEYMGMEDPYGFQDHCSTYVNYDPTGDFFGTRNLPDTCFSADQNLFATKACHDSLYQFLPIATNFLQQTFIAQYCGKRGYHDYDPGEGFTPEQFANIRYTIEYDYTGCKIVGACNFDTTSTYLLRFEESESICRFPCELDSGCLVTDAEYQSDYSLYTCSGISLGMDEKIIPKIFSIENIYPNPFNPSAQITYGLRGNSFVTISIYDITGRQITILINGFQKVGNYSVTWNASTYPSGIYFITISSPAISDTRKIVLIK